MGILNITDSDDKPVISPYNNNLDYEIQFKLCINYN